MRETGFLRGEVVTRKLATVGPNPWNPNVVPEYVMRSIEHGFRTDGWLVSQALLVWASDEFGDRKDIIIDGEHRWLAARAVGLEEGPMVFLDGLSEAEAKALTVKMNQKRGAWDDAALTELLRELETDGMALDAADFGFESEQFLSMLAVTVEELEVVEAPAETLATLVAGGQHEPPPEVFAGGSRPPVETGDVRVVQLVFTKDQREKFGVCMKVLQAASPEANIAEILLGLVVKAAAEMAP